MSMQAYCKDVDYFKRNELTSYFTKREHNHASYYNVSQNLSTISVLVALYVTTAKQKSSLTSDQGMRFNISTIYIQSNIIKSRWIRVILHMYQQSV
mgnify:CR=1 FL=1